MNFIPDAGRLLVAFGRDRLLQASAEFLNALLHHLHRHQAFRHLAYVCRALMHSAHHQPDFLAKDGVTIAAAETAHAAQIVQCESAGRAFAAAVRSGWRDLANRYRAGPAGQTAEQGVR